MENSITVTGTGPYLIKGSIQLIDENGNKVDTKESFALCRCGHSANKPFCDGSHRSKTEWLEKK